MARSMAIVNLEPKHRHRLSCDFQTFRHDIHTRGGHGDAEVRMCNALTKLCAGLTPLRGNTRHRRLERTANHSLFTEVDNRKGEPYKYDIENQRTIDTLEPGTAGIFSNT